MAEFRSGGRAVAPLDALSSFFRGEAAGGIVLVLASALALVIANSALAPYYESFLKLKLEVRLDDFAIAKPLLLWINDGLMAIFFLLVGLEIKREFVAGELSSRSQAILPGLAAVGGMVLPAVIFILINIRHPGNLNGWAIPAATDIAFALGVLALLGSRVPRSLKVLLTAIAILDDLGAIVIIAVFYTEQLSLTALAFAGAALLMLSALNLAGVRGRAPYLLLGTVLWVCVLKSGVHATLAGVALAIAIPMSSNPMSGDEDGRSPLQEMEHGLHPWVAFLILPLFGFANAGVSFADMTWGKFLEPVTLGIALGLFLGKQIGIFTTLRLAIRSGIAALPEGAGWRHLYGLACLCGIGFTMSLFIGSLAWEHAEFDAPIRLGVLTGSLLSAAVGAAVLLTAKREADTGAAPDQPAGN